MSLPSYSAYQQKKNLLEARLQFHVQQLMGCHNDKTPKIYGKYSVENKSNFQGGIEFESEIEIKQTRSSLNIVETLRDGVCESVTASLHQSTSNGKWFLYYTYLTHPKNAEDDMHYGTSILCIHNRDRLEGSYFTNRTNQTKGSQIMIRKK